MLQKHCNGIICLIYNKHFYSQDIEILIQLKQTRVKHLAKRLKFSYIWQNYLKVDVKVVCTPMLSLWQSFYVYECPSNLLWLWVFFLGIKQNTYLCTEIWKSNVGLDRMKIRERDAESGTNLDPSSKSISSCWQFFPQMPFWSTTPQYSKLS